MYGNLYIVSTPIGNLEDISFRAIRILKEAGIILAEDTRITKRLLSHYDIKKTLISYYEHNEEKRTELAIDNLKEGKNIALVATAGTPTISDPGYFLIKKSYENNIKVIPIPGACAFLSLLSASGISTNSFIFIGFLPHKKGKRNKILENLKNEEKSIILYESPYRIKKLLNELISCFGDRLACLGRELTKKNEELIRGNLSYILEVLEEKKSIKGEISLIIEKNINK